MIHTLRPIQEAFHEESYFFPDYREEVETGFFKGSGSYLTGGVVVYEDGQWTLSLCVWCTKSKKPVLTVV